MNDSAAGNGVRVARTVAVMGALACTASLLLAHVHPLATRACMAPGTQRRRLTDPDALVPGNNMEFHVPKAQERLDLVEFLKENTNK